MPVQWLEQYGEAAGYIATILGLVALILVKPVKRWVLKRKDDREKARKEQAEFRKELRDSYVFLPILLPFVVDAGAMFVGMFLGKHPFAPVLSPKKTVEGSVGGLIVGVGITLLYGLVFHFITDVEVNYYFLAVYGILGGVITEVGDLAFSYVKRNRKIKDFGHILPGHGGVLDRFDSVIFCAPLIELLIQWLPAFSKGAGA